MTPTDVAAILDGATRQGAAQDEPEGARFITLSHTLASQMAAALRPAASRPVFPPNIIIRQGDVPAAGDQ